MEPTAQLNLEFLAADGACSPHFRLALIVIAGLAEIREGLDPHPAPLISTDPEALSESERAELGIGQMPASLAEALKAFEADELFATEVPAELHACRRYTSVY